jgi:hypothetical protein
VGIDWNGLKNEFESGQEPLIQLAGKYGCHKDSIRRMARKEGWVRKPCERPARTQENRSGHLPDRHRNYWKGVERRLARGLKTKDIKQGLEELKVAKMAGEVISSMIRSKRLELGLEEAAAEKGENDADLIAAEMARSTAPSGAEEALD